jgi:hypothetical protein
MVCLLSPSLSSFGDQAGDSATPILATFILDGVGCKKLRNEVLKRVEASF